MSCSPQTTISSHLRRLLPESGISGILILDTRPVLDYFTRNALLAADLVLVPVKDRPSLVNVASILKAVRQGEGDPARVWLLPSLIDARLHLRADVGVREFLTFAARERGYQVLETFIAKSPKVEGLTTSFSSRIRPVITHARGTQVHLQFRELAEFVLRQIDQLRPLPPMPPASDLPAGRWQRLFVDCPVCREAADGREGYLFQEMRRRRLGFLHAACLDAAAGRQRTAVIQRRHAGSDLCRRRRVRLMPRSRCHLFDPSGERTWSERLPTADDQLFLPCCRRPPAGHAAEFHREVVLLHLTEGMPRRNLTGAGFERFAALRRRVLRELDNE